MKKKLLMLLGVFTVIIIASVVISKVANPSDIEKNEEEMMIVTSFYPMYILTANLVKDVPGVSVVNLTENQTGCLHDYQLTTQDMRKLVNADLLIMNGGGMESFIESVVSSYPDLEIIDASQGIEMLASESEHNHDHGISEEEAHTYEDELSEEEAHTHEHELSEEEAHTHGDELSEEETHTHEHELSEEETHTHEEESEEEHTHSHGEYNAHVWMNMEYYLDQMENIYHGLVNKDPVNRQIYDNNYQEYRAEIETLISEYKQQLGNIQNTEVVIFHDAFAYLAQEVGLDVIYTINMDADTSLSAREVKEIIDEINLHSVKVLFTEEQYSDSIAESVAKETEAKVYVIDSLVTGDFSLSSYVDGMRYNLKVLQEALQ